MALPMGMQCYQTGQTKWQSVLLRLMVGTTFLSYYGHVSMIASPGSLHQNRQCGLVHAASKTLIAVGSWTGIVLAPNLDLILAVTLMLARIPKRQTGEWCIPC